MELKLNHIDAFFLFAASDEEISVKNPAFMVTAALTHTCQMVELMASYLDVNLPKRINYRCVSRFSLHARIEIKVVFVPTVDCNCVLPVLLQ